MGRKGLILLILGGAALAVLAGGTASAATFAPAAPTGPQPPDGTYVQPTSWGPTYRVQSGDSITALATSLLGQMNLWPWLYDINRGVIGDNPNLLRVGAVLWVPSTDAVANLPATAVLDFKRRHSAFVTSKCWTSDCQPGQDVIRPTVG